jgi:hypothetical protein
MTEPNSYRIISEKTYQDLVNCATAIARHLDNRDGIERGVEKEFNDIAQAAWELDHDLNSGWYQESALPPKLAVGNITIVSEMPSVHAPNEITMALAIKAFPGAVVILPNKELHGGYVVWSIVDAYAVTEFQEYKDEWVLKRHGSGSDRGSHFWGFRIKYQELMKRKKELTIINEIDEIGGINES